MTHTERQALVDEVWARRLAYAVALNEERLAIYEAKRDLGRAWRSGEPPIKSRVPAAGAPIPLFTARKKAG